MYNVLKLARSLYRWTGDPWYADWYERGLLNGILGTQRMPRGSTQLPLDNIPPVAAVATGANVVPSYERPRPGNHTRQLPNTNTTQGMVLFYHIQLNPVPIIRVLQDREVQ